MPAGHLSQPPLSARHLCQLPFLAPHLVEGISCSARVEHTRVGAPTWLEIPNSQRMGFLYSSISVSWHEGECILIAPQCIPNASQPADTFSLSMASSLLTSPGENIDCRIENGWTTSGGSAWLAISLACEYNTFE